MNIKMLDLHAQYQNMQSEIDNVIKQTLQSADFIQGKQVVTFSQALSKYLDHVSVIPCGNGTDALQVALMAMGLKPGDEVIVPAFTYIAPVEVVLLLNLTPVLVDVDQATFNIDPAQVEQKITSRTKAIIPVHLYGQCAPLEDILTLAAKHNLMVLEDNAQALGAQYYFSDQTTGYAGTLGTIGTTSFFPSKNLGCYGDGGAIFTRQPQLANAIKRIANHGQQIKYRHDQLGVNSRLDTLQAGILNIKLKYLDEAIKKRQQVASFYDKALADQKNIRLPYRVSYSSHTFHQYTIVTTRRDELKNHLEKHHIPSSVHYPLPVYAQPAYCHLYGNTKDFPVAEALAQTVLSLPIHTEIKEDELIYIVEAINKFFA